MIIDSHAHFEPRMLVLDRVLAKMDAAGVDRIALIPTMCDPLPHTPERLLAVMRRAMRSDVLRPLVELAHRSTLTKSGDLKLAGELFRIYAEPDNASVAEVVAKHPDRFLGWIFLNPAVDPEPVETLERWRAEPGMIGVKLHPHWHDYRTELLDPILRRCEELRLPVLVHLGFRKRGDYRAICERFPRLTVISAHAGFPHFDALWKKGRSYPRLYVDLSSPYIDEKLARDAVAALGPERCLYGTDAPYGFHEDDGTYDYRAIQGWIDRMPIASRDRDRILGGTFEALLAGARAV